MSDLRSLCEAASVQGVRWRTRIRETVTGPKSASRARNSVRGLRPKFSNVRKFLRPCTGDRFDFLMRLGSRGSSDRPNRALVGSGEAQERGIVGEMPNLAARLQGIAEPNTVVMAEGTRNLVEMARACQRPEFCGIARVLFLPAGVKTVGQGLQKAQRRILVSVGEAEVPHFRFVDVVRRFGCRPAARASVSPFIIQFSQSCEIPEYSIYLPPLNSAKLPLSISTSRA
jgi:hypothetical protein